MQDINTSLYVVTVDRLNRARRRLGQRVPRYTKFLQVGPGPQAEAPQSPSS